ncbi:1-phosphofructokinase family hexose kinase [Jatrophihabitans telluris]|uniref:1-phosphofructokinase family hexose kinase n=1 Tax=Jatrophihabitans telluris TaxID=2038343 RepID=A0ABY4QXH3_9ACTN|nr:1-phosphofructokinase family hexose kinase [Jatrophihabitans telluris]UQX88240.1 1-phosphofructokinase family hexose kinase [Jatrophihabitans telluris]
MILAVCLNAAIDVTYTVDRIQPGASHRVREVRHRAGGKAVNVARVLRQLGEPARLLAFAGSTTGQQLAHDLAAAGLDHRLVPTAGDTRRTVTVVDIADATVFNEPGPVITPAEWAVFVEVFRDEMKSADLLVLAGSLPRGLEPGAYGELIELAHLEGVPAILDADGPALDTALPARPFLVKPNHHELAELVGRSLTSANDVHLAAAELADRGPSVVLVSRGEQGLIAVTPDGTWQAGAPERVRGNPTGAGDSLVAAVAAGVRAGKDWPAILADGIATSAAAVAVEVAGEIDPATRARLRPRVLIESVSTTRAVTDAADEADEADAAVIVADDAVTVATEGES